MFAADRRRRIVCVAGRDDDSLVALMRAREWQKAWGSAVRVVFLTSADTPPTRVPDAAWFQCWAASKAGLVLDMRDISLCDVGDLPTTLDDALGGLAGLLVFPAPSDPSAEIARVALHMLWSKAARLEVPLLIARRTIAPRRILAISDGTPRTLPVLHAAFDLGQHTRASLAYLNASLIPLSTPPPGARAQGAEARVAPGRFPAADGQAAGEPSGHYQRAARGLSRRMASAGTKERADMLVIGATMADPGAVDELSRTAPCSVLVVPCRAGVRTPTR